MSVSEKESGRGGRGEGDVRGQRARDGKSETGRLGLAGGL